MLIHITPKLLTCAMSGPNCTLVDLSIPELGIALRGDRDLVTRNPYPNKTYRVVSRKVGRKAMDGILINTPSMVRSFTAVMRWAAGAELLVKHSVKYVLIDEDHDFVSDSMVMWSRWHESVGGWGSRMYDVPSGWTPANAQPRMDVSLNRNKKGDFKDTIVNGVITERAETFRLPTLEIGRFDSARTFRDRFPSIEAAFHASMPANTSLS